MRYLVLGQARSGTTALARAIELGSGRRARVEFEPHNLASVTAKAASRPVVVKMLIDHWSPDDKAHIGWFDRCVFLARDPRDVTISRLLYGLHDMKFIRDSHKRAQFLAALQSKERAPQDHSVHSLFCLAARLEGSASELTHLTRLHQKAVHVWHDVRDTAYLLRYEDFVDERTQDLSAYLGFPATSQVDVHPALGRVTRTRAHGDWKHWFTPRDDDLARKAFSTYMHTFGYDDWNKPARQIIPSEHSSEYVEQIVADARSWRARLRTALARGRRRVR